MTINFKVIFGAVGAIVGGVAGFLTGRHYGRKKGYSEALRRYEEINNDICNVEINPVCAEASEPVAIEVVKEETKVPIDFGDVVEVVDQTVESYTKSDRKKKKHPYMIDGVDAGNDGYSIVTLHFHRGSNTVTNEDDTEEVYNVKDIIGFDVLNELESYSEPITLYVRNEKLEIDYEVICIEGNWGDTK